MVADVFQCVHTDGLYMSKEVCPAPKSSGVRPESGLGRAALAGGRVRSASRTIGSGVSVGRAGGPGVMPSPLDLPTNADLCR
jgi:hypothetical protein